MKLPVIVPVHNEALTVKKVLERLIRVKEVQEIAAAHDGSPDKAK